MKRYVCIHGHFYQPPRENPWLESIEAQDSAYPYHDWNERITDECYRPNWRARMLDADGYLVRAMNNYDRMSFNVGPTLMSWMQDHAKDVYDAILRSDRRTAEQFGGHGNALAQVYNHMIMPLANARDKRTQVLWGVRDFEHRFGRTPEGMWLAETAVDTPTLEALAAAGIRFTILAPRQAARVRCLGEDHWHDVGAGVNPSMPYLVNLPSGRSIAAFFYDGTISQRVAFERLLDSGERLAHALTEGFDHRRGQDAELVHIATDGETYGHHHRFGEMALAYALNVVDEKPAIQLTNYATFLADHPPTCEAQIVELSSWSCAHGVDRWRGDCGCNSGGRPGWNQKWRAPLRAALDWLRDTVAPAFEREGGALVRDPWAARDDYIELVLDRSPDRMRAFLDRHAARELGQAERVRLLQLMELQRHAMLMYTSCGWFFDEVSGIETVQVLAYAARVLQLSEQLLDLDIEHEFLARLGEARSNIIEYGDAAQIYARFVRPMMVTSTDVAAHYAVSRLFDVVKTPGRIYCYSAADDRLIRRQAGRAKLLVGSVTLRSIITEESARVSYAVVHLGDHLVNGGMRIFRGDNDFDALVSELKDPFDEGDFPELFRRIEDRFGTSTYSIRSLFRDEQRQVMERVLESSLTRVLGEFRQINERFTPMLRFLRTIQIPAPRSMLAAAECVVNADLREALRTRPMDADRVSQLVEQSRLGSVPLDEPMIRFELARAWARAAKDLRAGQASLASLGEIRTMLQLSTTMPFEVDASDAQLAMCRVRDGQRGALMTLADAGDEDAGAIVKLFDELAARMRIRL